jgi:hypothetical protein
VIDYEEALHRFPKRCAMRPSMMAGVVVASFFATLGVALIVVLVHWA